MIPSFPVFVFDSWSEFESSEEVDAARLFFFPFFGSFAFLFLTGHFVELDPVALFLVFPPSSNFIFSFKFPVKTEPTQDDEVQCLLISARSKIILRPIFAKV